MNEILINVLSVVITSVILPLITFAGVKITQWLSTKIKDEKARNILTSITNIITSSVASVFQTYVDSLKKEGKFDKEAQINALALARDKVLSELREDAKAFISENFGDMGEWIANQIEATIYTLKNRSNL